MKRQTHKQALLLLLSDHQPHHMSECIKVGGYRYGGRLHELRKEGREIETIRLGEDEFAYRYVRFAHPVEPKQLELGVNG